MLKVLLKLIALIGFCVASVWVYKEPSKYDSWVAAVGAVALLLGLFLPEKLRHKAHQNQKIRDGSVGIQAGGNVSINNNSPKDE